MLASDFSFKPPYAEQEAALWGIVGFRICLNWLYRKSMRSRASAYSSSMPGPMMSGVIGIMSGLLHFFQIEVDVVDDGSIRVVFFIYGLQEAHVLQPGRPMPG